MSAQHHPQAAYVLPPNPSVNGWGHPKPSMYSRPVQQIFAPVNSMRTYPCPLSAAGAVLVRPTKLNGAAIHLDQRMPRPVTMAGHYPKMTELCAGTSSDTPVDLSLPPVQSRVPRMPQKVRSDGYIASQPQVKLPRVRPKTAAQMRPQSKAESEVRKTTFLLCRYCPFKAHTKDQIQNHILIQHPQRVVVVPKTFTCNYCVYITSSELCMVRHLLTSHRSMILPSRTDNTGVHNIFSCSVCTFSADESTMINHMLDHYKDSIPCNSCSSCLTWKPTRKRKTTSMPKASLKKSSIDKMPTMQINSTMSPTKSLEGSTCNAKILTKSVMQTHPPSHSSASLQNNHSNAVPTEPSKVRLSPKTSTVTASTYGTVAKLATTNISNHGDNITMLTTATGSLPYATSKYGSTQSLTKSLTSQQQSDKLHDNIVSSVSPTSLATINSKVSSIDSIATSSVISSLSTASNIMPVADLSAAKKRKLAMKIFRNSSGEYESERSATPKQNLVERGDNSAKTKRTSPMKLCVQVPLDILPGQKYFATMLSVVQEPSVTSPTHLQIPLNILPKRKQLSASISKKATSDLPADKSGNHELVETAISKAVPAIDQLLPSPTVPPESIPTVSGNDKPGKFMANMLKKKLSNIHLKARQLGLTCNDSELCAAAKSQYSFEEAHCNAKAAENSIAAPAIPATSPQKEALKNGDFIDLTLEDSSDEDYKVLEVDQQPTKLTTDTKGVVSTKSSSESVCRSVKSDQLGNQLKADIKKGAVALAESSETKDLVKTDKEACITVTSNVATNTTTETMATTASEDEIRSISVAKPETLVKGFDDMTHNDIMKQSELTKDEIDKGCAVEGKMASVGLALANKTAFEIKESKNPEICVSESCQAKLPMVEDNKCTHQIVSKTALNVVTSNGSVSENRNSNPVTAKIGIFKEDTVELETSNKDTENARLPNQRTVDVGTSNQSPIKVKSSDESAADVTTSDESAADVATSDESAADVATSNASAVTLKPSNEYTADIRTSNVSPAKIVSDTLDANATGEQILTESIESNTSEGTPEVCASEIGIEENKNVEEKGLRHPKLIRRPKNLRRNTLRLPSLNGANNLNNLDSEDLVICPYCPKRLLFRLLPAHVQFHGNDCEHRCKDCNFATSFKWVLDTHVLCHKEPSQCDTRQISEIEWKNMKDGTLSDDEEVEMTQRLLIRDEPLAVMPCKKQIAKKTIAKKVVSVPSGPYKRMASNHSPVTPTETSEPHPVNKTKARCMEDFFAQILNDRVKHK